MADGEEPQREQGQHVSHQYQSNPFSRAMLEDCASAANDAALYNRFTGMPPDSAEKAARVSALLQKKLGPEMLATRQGGGGTKLTYIEGWKAINLANEVFGYNGWSTDIRKIEVDFMDYNELSQRWNVGVSAIVRVRLRDGTSHEDLGYGQMENSKSRGAGLDKAKKEAVTDGVKRALRFFGPLLGNCTYDKFHLDQVGKMKPFAEKFDFDQVYRPSYVAARTKALPGGVAPTTPAKPSTTVKPEPTGQKPNVVQAKRPLTLAQQAVKPQAQPQPRPPPPPAAVAKAAPPPPQRAQTIPANRPTPVSEPITRPTTADLWAGNEDDSIFEGMDLDALEGASGELVFEGDSGFAEGGLENVAVPVKESPPQPEVATVNSSGGAASGEKTTVPRTAEQQEQARREAQRRKAANQAAKARQEQEKASVLQQQQAATANANGVEPLRASMSAAQMLRAGVVPPPAAVPKPGLRPNRPPPSRAATVATSRPASHATAAAPARQPTTTVQAGQLPNFNLAHAGRPLAAVQAPMANVGEADDMSVDAAGLPVGSFTSARGVKRSLVELSQSSQQGERDPSLSPERARQPLRPLDAHADSAVKRMRPGPAVQ